MSLLFLDLVQITPITKSAPHGATVEGSAFISKAYVELEDKIRRAQDGTPLKPQQLFLLPVGTSINKDDMIVVQKMGGVTVTGDDAIRREVVKVFKPRGIGISHLEVTTESGGR